MQGDKGLYQPDPRGKIGHEGTNWTIYWKKKGGPGKSNIETKRGGKT